MISTISHSGTCSFCPRERPVEMGPLRAFTRPGSLLVARMCPLVGQAPKDGLPSAHDNPSTRQRIHRRRKAERSSLPHASCAACVQWRVVPGSATPSYRLSLDPAAAVDFSRDSCKALFCLMARLTMRRNTPASTASHARVACRSTYTIPCPRRWSVGC